MNKFQRAKSKKVKMHIRLAEIFTGTRPTYKEAKRKIRAYERYVKAWRSPVPGGLRAHTCVIDEMHDFTRKEANHD